MDEGRNGNVNEGMAPDDGDGISIQAPNNNPKTIVSFVLDEDKKQKEGTKEDITEEQKGYPRSILLSLLYAFMLVLIGICFPITEAIRHYWYQHHVVGVYMAYLFTMSIVFLVYLEVVITKRKRREAKQQSEKDDQDEEGTSNTGDNVLVLRRRMRSSALPKSPSSDDLVIIPEDIDDIGLQIPKDETLSNNNRRGSSNNYPSGPRNSTASLTNTLPGLRQRLSIISTDTEMGASLDSEEVQEYISDITQTASLAHEGTSFYLRLGCLVFAIGNLLYVSLEILDQVQMYQAEECAYMRQIRYPSFFHLAFLIIQTYFLFKNSMISIGKGQKKPLVRFGIMHLIATNLCIWVRFTVFEVMEAIEATQTESDEDMATWGEEEGNGTKCNEDTLLHKASPYLFPFVLEYSLIALATFAGMFASLNVAVVTKDVIKAVKKAIQMARAGKDRVKHHAHHKEGTFAKSHVGLFVGTLVLAAMVICIVLFYTWNDIDRSEDKMESNRHATLMYHSVHLATHSFMFIAVIVGFVKFFKLGFSLTRDNTIDHVLLLLSVAGLIMLETFIMISSFSYITLGDDQLIKDVSIMACVASIVDIIQALFQSIFIIDGMQRYSSSRKDQRSKPGRGAVTFLVITNLSLWIYKSFQIKQISIERHYLFFGSTAWAIILNVNLPLMVFYRFHSSVCLADMWMAAYEPEGELPIELHSLY